MNYYCYIAGLPDIHIEDAKLPQTMAELKGDLQDVLSDDDAQLLDMLFLYYDNKNLLQLLPNYVHKKKEVKINDLGIFTEEELNEIIQQVKDTEVIIDKRVPAYFPEFITAYLDEKPLQEGMLWEDQLSALYYSYAMKSRNEFLADWFEFNLNLNNIISAQLSRKYGYDVKKLIVGTNEIASTIRKSNSRDFGLSGMFEQLDEVLRILDENNLIEKEKSIDRVRWNYLDENVFFHTFSIEKILTYVLQMQIIDRWLPLNKEHGGQIFREMIEAMKESVTID